MLSLLPRSGLERALDIVENSEAIQSAALEIPVVIIGHADYLLTRLHLFDNRVIGPVENLYISQIKSDKDKAIIAQSVEYFELSGHFLFDLELISGEKV